MPRTNSRSGSSVGLTDFELGRTCRFQRNISSGLFFFALFMLPEKKNAVCRRQDINHSQ